MVYQRYKCKVWISNVYQFQTLKRKNKNILIAHVSSLFMYMSERNHNTEDPSKTTPWINEWLHNLPEVTSHIVRRPRDTNVTYEIETFEGHTLSTQFQKKWIKLKSKVSIFRLGLTIKTIKHTLLTLS